MTSLQLFFLAMAAFAGFCSGLAVKGPATLGAFAIATLKALGCAVGGVVLWVGVMALGNLALGGDPDRFAANAPGAAIFALYSGLMAAAIGFAPTAVAAALGLGLRQALNRLPKPERPPAFTPTIPPEPESD